MQGDVLTVSSWNELQEILYQDSYNANLKRFRSSYMYRGMDDSSYDLSTSLNRLGESHLERHLLRNFRKYSNINDPNRSLWNWMALAQHHGLPTRLLDWTYSPLVALHFATSNFRKFDRDGILWAVNYVDSIECLPEKLKRIIRKEGSHIFTEEMLDRGVKSLEALSELKSEDFAVFLEPSAIDQRIVNQYAVFSMLSNPNASMEHWLPGKNIRYFKIIIPAELKWEIRDKLDQANISERILFPGLDGLATWLKRHYKDIR